MPCHLGNSSIQTQAILIYLIAGQLMSLSTSRTAISAVTPAALPEHSPLELEAQAIAHSHPCHLEDPLASNPLHKKDSKEPNLRTHHKC